MLFIFYFRDSDCCVMKTLKDIAFVRKKKKIILTNLN